MIAMPQLRVIEKKRLIGPELYFPRERVGHFCPVLIQSDAVCFEESLRLQE
jgi:hypothetical protein